MANLIELDDIIWDKKIYPRNNKSDNTIEGYAEAMEAGAIFPPLEIQKVSNYLDEEGELSEAYLILDGVHRLFAYRALEVKETEVIEWQPSVVIDYAEEWISLLLRSASLNTKHGDRVGSSDKKAVARTIAEVDPKKKYTEQHIADMLDVPRRTINNWINDIRAKQNAGRDSVITRLTRLGWTQEQIAGVVGVSDGRIAQILSNGNFAKIKDLFEQGKTIDWIAEHYSIDQGLVWTLLLDGKTDLEKFGGSKDAPRDSLGWGLRTWDNWYFGDCDERFGDDWPGRIPGQLVAHTLFYFTNPGDLVFDPMAGGGVVPDVCLAFNRKCRAYDLNVRDARPEIEHHHWSLVDMEWPDLNKAPDLIFFDPPYFTKMKDDYKEKTSEGDVPISDLSRADYLAFFHKFFILAKEKIAKGGRMAFLNAGWRDFQGTQAIDEDEAASVTVLDYAEQMKKAGWIITHIIDCPLSSQRFTPGVVSAMQKSRILGTTSRFLIIGKVG